MKTLSLLMLAGGVIALPGAAMAQAVSYGNNGPYCREYTQTATIGGQTQTTYGTACLQPDGTWAMANGGGNVPVNAPVAQAETYEGTPVVYDNGAVPVAYADDYAYDYAPQPVVYVNGWYGSRWNGGWRGAPVWHGAPPRDWHRDWHQGPQGGWHGQPAGWHGAPHPAPHMAPHPAPAAVHAAPGGLPGGAAHFNGNGGDHHWGRGA